MLLGVVDRVEALLPQIVEILGHARQALAVEVLGVHAHDEHLLVVAAVEDADAAALGQRALHAPQEVVIELLGVGCLNA